MWASLVVAYALSRGRFGRVQGSGPWTWRFGTGLGAEAQPAYSARPRSGKPTPGRSTISVVIVVSSVQSRWGTFAGQNARSLARSVVVSPPTDVRPSPSMQTTRVSFGPGCS